MTLQRAVLIAGIANLLYFGFEFTIAMRIGSVSLFADSVDFFEDACVNFLVMIGITWSASARGRLGTLLSVSILVPGVATLWTIVAKLTSPSPPAAVPLALTGLGAFAVNLICALLLARFRSEGGSLSHAAFLSARNDVFANVAIVIAGLVTAATLSFLPDLIVGIGIAAMNLNAAHQVFTTARQEIKGVA